MSPGFDGGRVCESLKALNFGVMPDRFNGSDQEGWLLVNTTDAPIFARLGAESTPLLVAAYSQEMANATRTRELDLVQFAARLDDEAKVFYSMAWPVYDNTRYLVIFRRQPDSERISVIRIAGGSSR